MIPRPQEIERPLWFQVAFDQARIQHTQSTQAGRATGEHIVYIVCANQPLPLEQY